MENQKPKKAAKPTPTEDFEPGSQFSRDATSRHSGDQLLRRHGFKIHSRPADGEAVWIKNGVLFRHAEALLRVSKLTKSLEHPEHPARNQ